LIDSQPSQVLSQLERVAFGVPSAAVADLCERDGGVILTGVLTNAEVAATNAELDAAMNRIGEGGFSDGAEHFAAFMGQHTKRLAHALKFSPTYRDRLLCNPLMLDYVASVVPGKAGTHSLFASQAIEIFPGETAQELHRDGRGLQATLGLYHCGGTNLMANALLALTDISEEMGATRVVPGSHLWDDYSQIPSQEETVPALLRAGDVLFLTGKTLHGGGANVTHDKSRRVISSAFSVPFFMGEEAWPFALSAEEVADYPSTLQAALGFRSITYRGEEPGFLWRVETRPLQDHLKL
jgi:ectoine hydroxylase-related dioxygenase (phytanoyl-CoA dioxygenase family)